MPCRVTGYAYTAVRDQLKFVVYSILPRWFSTGKTAPKGIIPAIVTPFTDDHEGVDEARLRRLVEHLINQGVNGVVPCGSTGEFTSLTVEERKRVVDIVVNQVKKRVPVVAGAGASSTNQALHLVKYVEDAGADAALVITPYYTKPASRGIFEHFREIAASTNLPIIMYNIPQLSGVHLPWQMVEDLACLDNVVGLKDSSGDMKYIMTLLEKVGDRLTIYCGYDEVVMPALCAGVEGAILASANVIPEFWLNIYTSILKGDLERARELQRKIQKLTRIITKSGPVGVKEALNLLGLNVGTPRLPLTVGGELTYEEREEMRIELERLGKIQPKIMKLEPAAVKPAGEVFRVAEVKPQAVKDFNLKLGEALVGEEPEVAHVEVVVGVKDGFVGEAFTRAKATPTPGHEPLLAVLEPNLMAKPPTLIIPTVTIKSMRQASIVYGPAQQAVAKAVVDTVAEGFIPKTDVDDLLIIANVFVHPAAVDRQRVYVNNYKAMKHALRKALEGRPTVEELLENRDRAKHPFKYSP